MNKTERENIAYEINGLADRMARREERLARYEAEGNKDKIALCMCGDARDVAKLQGIELVLAYMGYCKRLDPETNKFVIVKREKSGGIRL